MGDQRQGSEDGELQSFVPTYINSAHSWFLGQIIIFPIHKDQVSLSSKSLPATIREEIMRLSVHLTSLPFFGNILFAISQTTNNFDKYGAQRPFIEDRIIDVTTDSEFFGLNTFANLPYVNCLSPSKEGGRYDIAILGAPFDTVSNLFKKAMHEAE